MYAARRPVVPIETNEYITVKNDYLYGLEEV
jgi:hypothetical protein